MALSSLTVPFYIIVYIKSVKRIAQPIHMEAKILSRAAFDDDVFYYASSFREIFPLADAIDLLPPFFYVASAVYVSP